MNFLSFYYYQCYTDAWSSVQCYCEFAALPVSLVALMAALLLLCQYKSPVDVYNEAEAGRKSSRILAVTFVLQSELRGLLPARICRGHCLTEYAVCSHWHRD